jgi:hypothetical protein
MKKKPWTHQIFFTHYKFCIIIPSMVITAALTRSLSSTWQWGYVNKVLNALFTWRFSSVLTSECALHCYNRRTSRIFQHTETLFLHCRHFVKALNSCCQLVHTIQTWLVYGSFHISIIFVRVIVWKVWRFENEWIMYSSPVQYSHSVCSSHSVIFLNSTLNRSWKQSKQSCQTSRT